VYEVDESRSHSEDRDPDDRFMLVYLIMVLIGAGLLYPYNTLITASDYFDSKFGADRQTEYYITMVLTYPFILMFLVMLRYGAQLSFSIRIITAFTLQGVALAMVPVFVETQDADTGFWIVIAITFVIGLGTAVLQSSIYGFTSLLPSVYSQAMMAGQAIAGVSVSITRIITKQVFPETHAGYSEGGKIFFGVGAGCNLICAFGFLVVLRLGFVRFHMRHYHSRRYEQKRIQKIKKEERRLARDKLGSMKAMLDSPADSIATTPLNLKRNNTQLLTRTMSPYGLSLRNFLYRTTGTGARNSWMTEEQDYDAIPETVPKRSEEKTGVTSPLLKKSSASAPRTPIIDGGKHTVQAQANTLHKVDFWVVHRKVLPLGLCITCVFVITFLMFPGLTTQLQSEHPSLNNGWFVIILITTFNSFDVVGRYTPSYTFLGLTKDTLWIGVCMRLLLYPIWLLAFLNVYTIDVVVYAGMVLMAFSNGFLCTLAMMWGPELCEEPERETGGSIMGFYLNFGIFLGSHMALGISKFMDAVK